MVAEPPEAVTVFSVSEYPEAPTGKITFNSSVPVNPAAVTVKESPGSTNDSDKKTLAKPPAERIPPFSVKYLQSHVE